MRTSHGRAGDPSPAAPTAVGAVGQVRGRDQRWRQGPRRPTRRPSRGGGRPWPTGRQAPPSGAGGSTPRCAPRAGGPGAPVRAWWPPGCSNLVLTPQLDDLVSSPSAPPAALATPRRTKLVIDAETRCGATPRPATRLLAQYQAAARALDPLLGRGADHARVGRHRHRPGAGRRPRAPWPSRAACRPAGRPPAGRWRAYRQLLAGRSADNRLRATITSLQEAERDDPRHREAQVGTPRRRSGRGIAGRSARRHRGGLWPCCSSSGVGPADRSRCRPTPTTSCAGEPPDPSRRRPTRSASSSRCCSTRPTSLPGASRSCSGPGTTPWPPPGPRTSSSAGSATSCAPRSPPSWASASCCSWRT